MKPYRLTTSHVLAAVAASAAAMGAAFAATPAATNSAGAAPYQHPHLGASSPHTAQPGPKIKPVNLNTASRAELLKLPGIGPSEADRIIKARPYFSKAKLLAENVISAPLYDGLKGRVFAGPAPGLKVPQPQGGAR
jgi:DNA uptake protein ComE-like DNA-binding protein